MVEKMVVGNEGGRVSETDNDILSAFECDDVQGLQKLVERFGAGVLNLCSTILADTAEAEDAVQEVFLKIWRGRNHLRAVKNLHGWIMKIATNESLDRLRARKRRGGLSFDIDDVADRTPASIDVPLPSILEQVEDVGRIREAIGRLPEKYRLILACKFQQDMENAEIARLLEISLGNARVLLCRALALLRKEVQK